MVITPQQSLFGWQEIDELGDLQRLLLVVNHLHEEKLMRKLEKNAARAVMTTRSGQFGIPSWRE